MSISPTVTMFPLIFYPPNGSVQFVIVPHAPHGLLQCFTFPYSLLYILKNDICFLTVLELLLVSQASQGFSKFTSVLRGSCTPQEVLTDSSSLLYPPRVPMSPRCFYGSSWLTVQIYIDHGFLGFLQFTLLSFTVSDTCQGFDIFIHLSTSPCSLGFRAMNILKVVCTFQNSTRFPRPTHVLLQYHHFLIRLYTFFSTISTLLHCYFNQLSSYTMLSKIL